MVNKPTGMMDSVRTQCSVQTPVSSALLTGSTDSIAAPSWVRNYSIAAFIGAWQVSPPSVTRLIASFALPPKANLPLDLRTTPAASSGRTPPSRPRASPHSRASAYVAVVATRIGRDFSPCFAPRRSERAPSPSYRGKWPCAGEGLPRCASPNYS